MKRFLTILALLAALLLPSCAPAASAPADEPLPALTLLPDDAAPETAAAPDAQADDADAQAPPAALQTESTEAEEPAPAGEADAMETDLPQDGEADAAETDLPQTGEQGAAAADLPQDGEPERTLPEDGSYTGKEDVALYLHLYGHLPGNFITKKEAEALGWPGGSLEPYAPGKSIGGSRFGNYEGLLPDAPNRRWTECDIDTRGAKSRGAKRIVFSNDGLIYYTGDHYRSFELLYGEE